MTVVRKEIKKPVVPIGLYAKEIGFNNPDKNDPLHLPIFWNIVWSYEQGYNYIRLPGGSSSGKTYSTLEFLILMCHLVPGLRVRVVGQDVPNLKRGPKEDLASIVSNNLFLSYLIFDEKRVDRKYMIRTFDDKRPSYIQLLAFDTEQKAKQGKFDVLFVNEANGVPYAIFEQQDMRATTLTIIDYNPSAEFWGDTVVGVKKDCRTFRSNYTHNPYINPKTKQKLLDYRLTDKNRYRVYTLGLTGKIEGLVYPHWQKCEEIPPHITNRFYGLDFGHAEGFDCLIEGGLDVKNKRAYIDERLYVRGNTEQDRIDHFKRLGIRKDIPMYCDYADASSIQSLKDAGYMALPCDPVAKKTTEAIGVVRSHELLITETSHNLIVELNNLIYYIDKRTGKVARPEKPDPKCIDHACDAKKYGLVSHAIRSTKKGGIKGAYFSGFNRDTHVSESIKLNPKSTLHIALCPIRNGYAHAVLFQVQGDQINVVDSITKQAPDNTVGHLSEDILANITTEHFLLPSQLGRVICYTKPLTRSKEDLYQFAQDIKQLKRTLFKKLKCTSKSSPLFRESRRYKKFCDILLNDQAYKLRIHPRCTGIISDMQLCMQDAEGDLKSEKDSDIGGEAIAFFFSGLSVALKGLLNRLK